MAHNFRLVYTRLEDHNQKYGSYPPQQDMRSLLKTLRLSDGDLFKVSIDIGSAVYHAPKQKKRGTGFDHPNKTAFVPQKS